MIEKSQKKEDGAEQEDLWSSILNDVRTSSAPRQRVAAKNLVVVGDVNTGKNSIIHRLQQKDTTSALDVDEARGCGMEYTYIDVQYEDFDDVFARLGVWILDGDEKYHPLLSYCLNDSNFDDAAIMVVLDLSKPWSALASLQRWMSVLQQHVNTLKMDPKRRKDADEKLVKFFQSYVDPSEADATAASTGPGGDEEKVLLPLGESVLVENLGIPIIVVATKSDAFTQLEKEEDYSDEHFDFIQLHLRRLCLRYGASLVYTSSKDSRNCELLYSYVIHIAYQLPFKSSATVVDRDAIFVPIGWDSDKKISLLHEQMATMSAEDAYEDRITEPPSRKTTQDQVSITAEADQIFLLRQQAHLGIPATSGGTGQSRPGETPGTRVAAPNRSPRAERKSVTAATPTATAAAAGSGQSGETVLASFFQSLLQKKPGGATGRSPGTGGTPAAASGSGGAAGMADLRAALEKSQPAKKS